MRISDWSSDVCSSDLALTAEDRTYNQVIMRGWRSAARRYPINGQRNLTPETNMIEQLSYTVNEAAATAGISRRKLYELSNTGELMLVKIGRRTQIDRTVLAYITGRQVGVKGKSG